jgi:Flp pilus assembly protein TadG
MMRKIIKKRKGQRGASAIEFAIILPVLLVILVGIMEFGYVMYAKAVITNASREGARRGIVFSDPRPTDAEIVQAVDDYCTNLIPSATATTQVTRVGDAAGDPLTVRVNYLHSFWVLHNLPFGIAGPIDLGAETVMRME